MTKPEGGQLGASQVARQGPGASWPWPAPGLCLGPPGLRRLRLFAHIISVAEKPKGPEKKSTKSYVAAVSAEPISGGSEALPGTLPEGEVISGGLYIAMPASAMMCE